MEYLKKNKKNKSVEYEQVKQSIWRLPFFIQLSFMKNFLNSKF